VKTVRKKSVSASDITQPPNAFQVNNWHLFL